MTAESPWFVNGGVRSETTGLVSGYRAVISLNDADPHEGKENARFIFAVFFVSYFCVDFQICADKTGYLTLLGTC